MDKLNNLTKDQIDRIQKLTGLKNYFHAECRHTFSKWIEHPWSESLARRYATLELTIFKEDDEPNHEHVPHTHWGIKYEVKSQKFGTIADSIPVEWLKELGEILND